MKDNEKLIELLKQAIAVSAQGNGFPELEEVVDYLLEHGVIIPPCKIGDTVYRIAKNPRTWEVLPRPVLCMTCKLGYFDGVMRDIFTTANGTLGNTVFLTREEAEAAIAERKGQK